MLWGAWQVPDAVAATTLFAVCSAPEHWAVALEAHEAFPGQADRRMYNALVSAAGRCGQCNAALRLLDDMRAEGVQPDRVTYNALISACAQGQVRKVAGRPSRSRNSRRRPSRTVARFE